MSRQVTSEEFRTQYETRTADGTRVPGYQAFQILRWGYFVLPLVAGLDKFSRLLSDWDHYLAAPLAAQFDAQSFMYFVGVVEVLAAFVVVIWPRLGGWLVAAWLWAIGLNLIIDGQYLDIALRDFALSLGAVALARLAIQYYTD